MGERFFRGNKDKAARTWILGGISAALLVPQIMIAPFQNPVIESYTNTSGELDGQNTHSEFTGFGCKLIIDKFEDFTKGKPVVQTKTSTSCE